MAKKKKKFFGYIKIWRGGIFFQTFDKPLDQSRSTSVQKDLLDKVGKYQKPTTFNFWQPWTVSS